MQEMVEVETPKKFCPGCEETKPATPEFFHQDRRPDRRFGLRGTCILCEKKRRDARKRELSERRGRPRPRRILGTPDQCGACGATTGNILGDVENRTQYGYLCYRCYKIVNDFHADLARIQNVVVYLKKTRKG